jgi:hypothetical protein
MVSWPTPLLFKQNFLLLRLRGSYARRGRSLPTWHQRRARTSGGLCERKVALQRGLPERTARRKLAPERLADIAEGTGEFAKAPVEAQLKAMMLLLAYSYGSSGAVQVAHEEESNALVIKRVIGVSDTSV